MYLIFKIKINHKRKPIYGTLYLENMIYVIYTYPWLIKNITCNLERNKNKIQEIKSYSNNTNIKWKTLKGKTTNNRSIINLEKTGQARPSELATTHL